MSRTNLRRTARVVRALSKRLGYEVAVDELGPAYVYADAVRGQRLRELQELESDEAFDAADLDSEDEADDAW